MIKELHQKLINKEITAQELIESYFKIIKEKDPKINAFITLTEDSAFIEARKIDEKIKKGEEIGLLEGIPYAVKDNILTKGIKTTAGSKILENYIGSYNATVINKLKEQKSIMVGKTNMDEFAMGSSTENSAFFPTKNPWDLSRVPGGSSGGSASAIASEMCVFSLGSDTGGSIRQPAAFCGVVGFKPSYGAVSRFGLIALASSLDVIGPFAKNVEDVEIVFKAICGKDDMDSTSLNIKPLELQVKGFKLGLPKEYFLKGLNKEIEIKIKEAVGKIEKKIGKTMEVSLPHTAYALPCYYIILPAEVSANLARYDGMRYSQISNLKSQISNLRELYFKTRGKGLGSEPRRRVILGTYVLSKGYYEAYYKKAQQVRKVIIDEFEKTFKEVDFLLTPTTPTSPFELGEKTQDPLSMYLSDIFTVAVNIAGLPGINIPCGFTKDNLPIGFQIIGPRYSDFNLLKIAKEIEKIIY